MTKAKLNQVFSEEIAISILKSSEAFPIDFDKAVKWWDCRTKEGKPMRRDDIVANLKADFIKDIDYIETSVENSGKVSGRLKGRMCLSIDCFKQFGMMISGERGDQIRRYFLDCETELKRKHEEEQKRRQWAAIKGCDLSEPKNWERQFPPEFWQELERVTGRPRNINARLVTYFYNRFPQKVHKQNTLQNPRNENGNRRAKTDQFLNQNFGVTALDLFKAQFIAVINVSPSGNYALFKKNLEKVFATEVQLELPLLDELEEERAT